MASILIVDDSKFMRKMLSDILTEEGHQIAGEAENAMEAIELYKVLNPDLVTLDVIMPEVEGVDTYSAVKEIVKMDSGTKIIIISTMGQEEIVKEYIEAGAKDFIIKPFQASDVAKAVTNAIVNS
ncbi:MAG: response regulator [Candidatus Neomarinimicrobiota bacterium]